MEVNHTRLVHDKCKKYKECHVVLQTSERALLEGVLLETNTESATLLTAENLELPDSEYGELRQIGGETFKPRYRRYKRIIIPLSTITTIYLFPYYYPSYPYVYQRNNPYYF